MPTRKAVFDVINAERDAQNNHLPPSPFELFDWLNFIDDHLLRARTAGTTDELRNLTACAVAAMEQYGVRARDVAGDMALNLNLPKLSDLASLLPDLDTAGDALNQRFEALNKSRGDDDEDDD
jgi:hypothetical protein